MTAGCPTRAGAFSDPARKIAELGTSVLYLIPRRADDPSPRMPVWTVEHAPKRLAPAEMSERVARIRAQLGV